MDARHIRGCDVPTHSTCRTVFTVPRSQSLQYTASMYVHNTSVHVCGACGCVRDGEHVHNVSVPVCGACVRVSVALLSSLSDSIYSTYEYESLRTDKTDRQVRRPTGSSRPAENLLIESMRVKRKFAQISDRGSSLRSDR